MRGGVPQGEFIMQLIVKQKWLGPRAFFVCILVIYLLQILAIDMYVPALPSMQRSFGVTEAYLNLTVFAFFICAAVGILFSGFISDSFGRRGLLIGGCGVFSVASALCMIAPSVELLIVFRILQALGYGTTITICTALIKDAYGGHDLKIAMTCLQSLIIIGPAFAPFLGTFILARADWRGVFAFLTACGIVTFLLSLLVSETHRRSAGQGGVGAALSDMLGGVRYLVRDRSFASLALFMGVAGIPYFAWIAVVSYILLDFFAVSYFDYSLCYAAACVVTIIAPYLYIAISRKLSVRAILVLCIALTAVGAALMFAIGSRSPMLFILAFVPYALAEGIVRPMGFVVLLDQPDEHVGAASSFSNFSYSVLTSFGTVLATLPWITFVFGIAVLNAAAAVVMALLFFWGLRSVGKSEAT